MSNEQRVRAIETLLLQGIWPRNGMVQISLI